MVNRALVVAGFALLLVGVVAAELTGVIPHGDAGVTPEQRTEAFFQDTDGLKNVGMGVFVLVCFVVLMRATGDY